MKLFESIICYNYLNGDFQSTSKPLHESLAIQLHVQPQTPAHLEPLNNGIPFLMINSSILFKSVTKYFPMNVNLSVLVS